ncbi:hypothetical protein RFI_21539 [Reticulomyxa filosa]|uniref:Uncharacterized protein n=2 Tax=Reticulomyxa filosa TaxID=46433 RepID=X6MRV0_RETFI|nr:hypothetical protein RFI_21539 [Reticulomyxa filosa]|eukprot:ETO15825.1 hypothetical protein RFI_21539 [Reticulomyxa filosa]
MASYFESFGKLLDQADSFASESAKRVRVNAISKSADGVQKEGVSEVPKESKEQAKEENEEDTNKTRDEKEKEDAENEKQKHENEQEEEEQEKEQYQQQQQQQQQQRKSKEKKEELAEPIESENNDEQREIRLSTGEKERKSVSKMGEGVVDMTNMPIRVTTPPSTSTPTSASAAASA